MPFYGASDAIGGMKGENFLSAFLLSLLPMFDFFRFCSGSISRCLHSGRSLLLENLALRQQLAVLTRRHPRPNLSPLDKLFWGLARRFWSAWRQALLVVTPETVVRWHRTGFRLYWSLISKVRRQVGSKPLSKEVRDLIFQMVAENSSWGAPRIHGELLMLGFEVSERTISRWMKRAPQDPEPARRWLRFLHNHREAIAAMDSLRYPRSPSISCTASSSSVMIGDAFSISTSPVIPPVAGSYSSCERRFLTSRHPGSSS
jgi:hypothetical protein